MCFIANFFEILRKGDLFQTHTPWFWSEYYTMLKSLNSLHKIMSSTKHLQQKADNDKLTKYKRQ